MRRCEISFLFVDNGEITLINKKYFGKDRPTDVIAFPQDFCSPTVNSEIYNLGDVVISVEQAMIQSKRLRKTFASEIALLIVHGILHLVGYDDRKPTARRKMRSMEKRLLARIAG